ncbi:MAG TPA: RNA polymerase factor sigma-54 [Bacteroidota bacterium]|nr:RNA polymerase factor sigma-54 [Bacteroidota bacterium]
MLNLSQRQTLQQKLTPQQVQYLQLLQLPILALEQRIKAELEMNPLLEEATEMEQVQETAEAKASETPENPESAESESRAESAAERESGEFSVEDYINDDSDGYKTGVASGNHEEREEYPQPAELTLTQRLSDQIAMLDLLPGERVLADEILGNIDEDGYLRRELPLILQDVNLGHGLSLTTECSESVLARIQRLDPPGIGSRSLQECLLVQMEIVECPEPAREIAMRILKDLFEDFTMKHYEDLARKLGIGLDELKEVLEAVRKLNPKPGEGQFTAQQNYIIPDFTVERVDDEFVITLNDRNVPPLRINRRYREMLAQGKKRAATNGVRDFLRKRFEAAKWFIASINQRRDTMMKVMRALVEKQREFFETGESLRPLIYRDIADIIMMDISTISRVVNGKYVQTEHGVFELRYFFSDKLTTDGGEEVSNKEVKKTVRSLIDAEDPHRPLSDDRIADMLRADGLHIARRTVAKYREAMKIPVARLRRKI